MQKKCNNESVTGAHVRALDALKRRNRYRAISIGSGLDFSSNDYLGLAGAPELLSAAWEAIDRGTPVGATGSRLLRGNHAEHEAVEAEAAAHFRSQGALFMASGFVANYALYSSLPMRGDLVVYDELIHASVHDGLRAGRAKAVAIRHNDAQAFQDAICAWRAGGGTGRAWIGVESLYSMDGDRAPLDELFEIAVAQEAFLVIDEAHATGVYGGEGRGLAGHLSGAENVITMHTCGKALGVMGAFVCAAPVLLDYIVNRSRAFVYATAPSPLIAAVVRAALKLSGGDGSRRERLHELVAMAGVKLAKTCAIEPSGSQIQPIVVGSDARALALGEAMQGHGFDIRAIRPPTVPVGTSRLRLSFTLNVSEDDVGAMIETLGHELSRIER